MKLEEKIRLVLNKLKERYSDNLAAWIIYGSAADGKWNEETSDIDSIIILKDTIEVLDINEEKKSLIKEIENEGISVVEFNKITEYLRDILSRGRWSNLITIIDPPKLAYSTPEFNEMQNKLLAGLKKVTIDNKKIIELIHIKDKFELGPELLGKVEGYKKVSCLHGHLRRKFQILNYYLKGNLVYDYRKNLESIKELFSEDEYKKLRNIPWFYEERKGIIPEDEGYFKELALKITEMIGEKLKN